MLRIKLVNNNSDFGPAEFGELRLPSAPHWVHGSQIVVHNGDVESRYWFEGWGESVFYADGPGEPASLEYSVLYVQEAMDTRMNRLEAQTGSTEA